MLGHRFRTIAAGAFASAALTLAACGGDDDAGGETTTTDPPAASTTTAAPSTTLDPAQQAEADVRAAYEAYWAMNERLAAAPDPQDPEIAERASGGALDALTTLLTQFMTEGYTVVFEANNAHDVQGVEVTGTSAHLRDCHVDHSSKRDAASGETIRESTATLQLDVTLVLDTGSWKVDDIDRIDIWDGIVECE